MNWFLSSIYDYALLILKSSGLFREYVVILSTWRMYRKEERVLSYRSLFYFCFYFVKKCLIIVLLYRRNFCNGHMTQEKYGTYFFFTGILENTNVEEVSKYIDREQMWNISIWPKICKFNTSLYIVLLYCKLWELWL